MLFDLAPKRSPLFYVGDKYKLMPQLKEFFPDNINQFIEPFTGGGSVFLNTSAKSYLANDIDKNIILLHKMFAEYSFEELMQRFSNIIFQYGLSFSLKNITVPDSLKKQFVKTYYAKFNKISYEKMRSDFNAKKNNIEKLYLLLIYGFNRILRFNQNGDFNLPVGNVDFNKNVYQAIFDYKNTTKTKNITFSNLDYKTFLQNLCFLHNDYIYLDPPYLISNSQYNKLWSFKDEYELYSLLDRLNADGIKFGITNLISHKGKINHILADWSKKYIIYNIKSNYISFNDNTIKEDSKEIFVTNYSKG